MEFKKALSNKKVYLAINDASLLWMAKRCSGQIDTATTVDAAFLK
jgi:hypothetical protein